MLKERQLCLRRFELRLGARDFLRPGTQFGQTQGFALLGDLGLGDLVITPGAIQVLSADAAPLGVGCDALQTLEILLGLGRIRLRRGDPTAGLCDLLGTRAGPQPQQGLLLNLDLRLRLLRLQGQRARVQQAHNRTGLHPVAFFGSHFRHAATAIEGQRDLADVHIAVQHQPIVTVALTEVPRSPRHETNSDGSGKEDKRFLHVKGLRNQDRTAEDCGGSAFINLILVLNWVRMQSISALESQGMNKPARGLRSDGEATRARILEATGELFATTGYAETTNKAIAAEARVDLASINYHFGNRSGLYQTVLAEAHRRLLGVNDLRELVESELAPTSKLRFLIEQLVQRATEEPQAWHLRILAREVLAPSSHLQVLFQNEALPKMVLVKRMLSEITKIPAEDPALTRCLLSVGAPCLMLLVGGRSFPGPLQEVFQMPPATVVEHLFHFAMGGMQAIVQEYEQAKS